MKTSANYRRVIVAFAERELRTFGGQLLNRTEALALLDRWVLREVLDDEERADLLSRFVAEPPSVPGLDFLPETQADADVLVAEAVAVLDEPKASPHGPCSGLAADKRDNTCTNPAAEYVSYRSPEWAGMTCRRLCVSCANAAPDVYSRRPLTKASGQSLLGSDAEAVS